MDEPGSYPVKLYIYDLSRGMARQLSPLMLGELLRDKPENNVTKQKSLLFVYFHRQTAWWDMVSVSF